MNIYISLDMEGMPGTSNWQQEKSDRESVKLAIYNHTRDVLEAILSSVENNNIKEIVIADSHANCDNLSYSITEIDRRIKLISGAPRPNYMMPALDNRFDMVFFLGYHSGCGTQYACMDHTYSNSKIQRIAINNTPMSEALINAAYAGCFNIPVALVSGDLSLRHHLLENNHLPWVEYISTKEAISKTSTINYSTIEVSENTKFAVQKVIKNNNYYKSKLFTFSSPIELMIEFKSTLMADVASLMPYTNRIDGRTVSFSDNDFKVIFEAIMALTTLAYSVTD